MNVESYFGLKCPVCSTTVEVGVGKPNCPSCGTRMIPNPNSRGVAANVYCAKCNAAFGLVTSPNCPTCGGAFSKIP